MQQSYDKGRHRGTWRRAAAALWIGAVVLAIAAGSALAAPAWRIDVNTNSNAAPGGTIDYHLQLANIGDAVADGTSGDPVAFEATLPSGLTVSRISVPTFFGTFDWSALPGWSCSGDGPGAPPSLVGAHHLKCTIANSIPAHGLTIAFGLAQPVVRVDVAGGASGTLTSNFILSGGNVPPADSGATAEATRITTEVPAFGVDSFDGEVTANAAGTPYTHAGGHPYAASTTIDFNTTTNPKPLIGPLWPIAAPHDIIVDLPPGFVGDPTSLAQCTQGQLASTKSNAFNPLCPPASQVGVTLVRINGVGAGSNVVGPLPVFNLVPPSNAPARFGFNVSGTVVTLNAELRSATDYGLSVRVPSVPEGLAITGTTLTIWGVPAADVHTPERACPGQTAPQFAPNHGPSCANGGPQVPFWRNPTKCTAPGVGLRTTVHMDSWKDPGRFVSETFVSHDPPGYPLGRDQWGREQGTEKCDRVPFDPTLRAAPAPGARAGSPTRFDFDLSIPQTEDPEIIGQSDLKKAVVTLPRGVRLSPSSAHGLTGCSPNEIGLDNTDDVRCLPGSKVGELTIDTPLLAEPLRGGIYLATPFDNPSRTLIALYLVAKGPGVIVKLPGRVDIDGDDRIVATFDDNPQLPFENLHLQFNDGPGAPIVTPDECGTYTTHSVLTGWSGKVVEYDSTFTIDVDADGTPCSPNGFSPGFSAGTKDPVAGKNTSFHLQLTRADQQQLLKTVEVAMPEGVTGKIASVGLCPAETGRTGGCPASSRIGSVTVGAGAGTNPFYITNGRVYLTGPYKGAPFGLSIVVPAVAGPFDLGNVVVPSAIFVDHHTAELRVVSEPLPTQLQGIQLDVRDVRVDINKPDFIINPTSCAEKQIRGTIGSTLGVLAKVASRFQVGECANLPIKPKMVLQVGKKGRTGRGVSTPFTATLTQTPGQTNLKSVKVTLPTTINARLTVINDACTRAQYEAGNCSRARTGTAVAKTPLLRDPLRGDVYFVRNGNPLPDLFVALRGQVSFDLIGKITIPGSKRLRTTFDAVPDVPISSFTLRLVSGRDGSIGTAANLCSKRGRTAKAEVDFQGQNGEPLDRDQRLKIVGCTKNKKPGRR